MARGKSSVNTQEQTGAQQPRRNDLQAMLSGTVWADKRRDSSSPQAPTFKTYRKMRENPTVALARIVATAPIRVAEWTLEADDGVPEEQVKFIQQQITGVWHNLVNDALLALDYGYAPGEVIYDTSEGQVALARVKPLAVDKTTILTDDHGNYAGLKNDKVELATEEAFLYSYDTEAGNLYGRPRHENIRTTAWLEWCDLQKKRAKYFKKSAGAVPQVHYPDGEGKDEGGAIIPNFRVARKLVLALQDGDGIAIPRILAPWASDLARDGKTPPEVEAWRIDFLESKSQHGAEFTDAMKHCESLMLRGWLVPERAASEAQTAGSRADSGTAADFAMLAVDLTLQDLVQCLNLQIVNPLMVLNFGNKATGTVRIKRAGVTPALQAFFRGLVTATLGQPANVALMLKLVDMNALVSAAGLPEPKDIPSQEDLEATAEASKPQPPQPGGEKPEKPCADVEASMVDTVLDVYRQAHGEYALGFNPDQPREPDGKFAPEDGGKEKKEENGQRGSANYEVRKSQGWIEGSAKYANEEPHHAFHEGGAVTYEQMYHAPTEQKLTDIIDNEKPGVTAKVTLVWNKKEGYRMLRSVSGNTEEIPIKENLVQEFMAKDKINKNHIDYEAVIGKGS